MGIELKLDYEFRKESFIKSHLFKAFIGDNLIGSYDFSTDPHVFPKYCEEGISVYLCWLNVKKEFRGNGYSEELIKKVIEQFEHKVSKNKNIHLLDSSNLYEYNSDIADKVLSVYKEKGYVWSKKLNGYVKAYGKKFFFEP